jgi:hypothetical protein
VLDVPAFIFSSTREGLVEYNGQGGNNFIYPSSKGVKVYLLRQPRPSSLAGRRKFIRQQLLMSKRHDPKTVVRGDHGREKME